MDGSPGDVVEATEGLENELWRRWNDGSVEEWAEPHVLTLLSPHLRQSSFSNPSVASSTSQLILKPFRRFTFVTAHSATLPSLYLRHSSFSNPSIASPTSQIILQPFRLFTYVTAHYPTPPSLHLRHSSFQTLDRFTYVTTHSTALPSLYLRHS